MSFLMPKSQKMPAPVPPTPRIGDAGQEASVIKERQRYKERRGASDTIMAGLGASSGSQSGGTRRATLLGGTAS